MDGGARGDATRVPAECTAPLVLLLVGAASFLPNRTFPW
jgi:hypothetical protein